MSAAKHENIEKLAFAHWQLGANEKAYANRLISKAAYEYARDELRRTIDLLSELCYSVSGSG